MSNQSGLTWGFAVFGKVVTGMDTIDKIAALPTRAQGPFVGDVPNPLVVIESASVVGEEKAAPAPSSSTAAPASAPAKPATTPARPATPKKGEKKTPTPPKAA